MPSIMRTSANKKKDPLEEIFLDDDDEVVLAPIEKLYQEAINPPAAKYKGIPGAPPDTDDPLIPEVKKKFKELTAEAAANIPEGGPGGKKKRQAPPTADRKGKSIRPSRRSPGSGSPDRMPAEQREAMASFGDDLANAEASRAPAPFWQDKDKMLGLSGTLASLAQGLAGRRFGESQANVWGRALGGAGETAGNEYELYQHKKDVDERMGELDPESPLHRLYGAARNNPGLLPHVMKAEVNLANQGQLSNADNNYNQRVTADRELIDSWIKNSKLPGGHPLTGMRLLEMGMDAKSIQNALRPMKGYPWEHPINDWARDNREFFSNVLGQYGPNDGVEGDASPDAIATDEGTGMSDVASDLFDDLTAMVAGEQDGLPPQAAAAPPPRAAVPPPVGSTGSGAESRGRYSAVGGAFGAIRERAARSKVEQQEALEERKRRWGAK